jgi:hypothetical protein
MRVFVTGCYRLYRFCHREGANQCGPSGARARALKCRRPVAPVGIDPGRFWALAKSRPLETGRVEKHWSFVRVPDSIGVEPLWLLRHCEGPICQSPRQCRTSAWFSALGPNTEALRSCPPMGYGVWFVEITALLRHANARLAGPSPEIHLFSPEASVRAFTICGKREICRYR